MPDLKIDNSEDEQDFHEAMAKAVTTVPRRRRSSASSWSSGQDVCVPETDLDGRSDGESETDNNPVVKPKV
jgi:hypothetical protein